MCILATSSWYLLLLLGPYHFCLLLCSSLHEIYLSISNFLGEISGLSHSIVFLYFFALITGGRLSYLSLLFFGTLHSQGYIFPFLLCLSLFFFSQLFVRPPQKHFAFLHFFFLGMVLIPASCTISQSSVHS